MKNLLRCITLLLVLVAFPAAAKVEVSFLPADKYIDIGDGIDARRNMKEIEQYLIRLGERYLAPDLRLSIEVIEVDLAGRMEMVGRRIELVRVLRGKVDAPYLRLRYTLRAGEQVLSQGEDHLTDLMYLDHADGNRADTPLYYEKRLLENWFKARFAPPVAKQ